MYNIGIERKCLLCGRNVACTFDISALVFMFGGQQLTGYVNFIVIHSYLAPFTTNHKHFVKINNK